MQLVQERQPLQETQPPLSRFAGMRRGRWTQPRSLASLLSIFVVAYLAVVPIATLVIASTRSNFLGTGASTWTLKNYSDTLSDGGFLRLLGSSIEYAAIVTVGSVLVGYVLAWLYVRTNTPAKSFTLFVSLVPLVIPGLVSAAAWVLLFSPRTGPLNVVLQALHLPEFPIYSMAGMVFVQSMHMMPLAFLMGMATLSSMDRSLEEAAAMSGAGARQVVGKITWPLIRPAVIGVSLIIFVLTISSFEVPQIIGVPARRWVLTTEIYNATAQFPVLYGKVAVLGIVVFGLALLGLYLSSLVGKGKQLETVTGKGFRPSLVDIGRWKWFAFGLVVLVGMFTVFLPILMLTWSSLLPIYVNPSASALEKLSFHNYTAIFSTPDILNSLKNTLIVSVATGLIVCLLCAVIAYILVKTKLPGRRILNALATAPIAIPSVIIGVALLYWYLILPGPVHLYGSRTVLVIAFVTGLIPVGLRFAEAGFGQISTELEEAASNSGAGWGQVLFRIYLPLLRPALVSIFLYSFIIASRELTTALFLYSPKSEVIAVHMYAMWVYGSYTEVCAIGMLMLLILAAAIVIVRRLSSRVGIQAQSLVP